MQNTLSRKNMGWKSPWLIQRLSAPEKYLHPRFGEGIGNGGLSCMDMKLLKPIFTFEYMGSTEFEIGAVPEALERLYSNVEKHYVWGTEKIEYEGDGKYVKGGTRDVHYLCHKDHEEELKSFLYSLAINDSNLRFKEPPMFTEALFPKEIKGRTFGSKTTGWLDLKNSAFWSIDDAMFLSFLELVKGGI